MSLPSLVSNWAFSSVGGRISSSKVSRVLGIGSLMIFFICAKNLNDFICLEGKLIVFGGICVYLLKYNFIKTNI